MTHILDIVSQKGGVGKSTRARMMAREFAAGRITREFAAGRITREFADLDTQQRSAFALYRITGNVRKRDAARTCLEEARPARQQRSRRSAAAPWPAPGAAIRFR